ncbi:MAG: class I SAM-dependent methyltransferase family protein [Promethearchaeota archaeon]|nr:MAG: class I SAM-dependent methyltransferase family protein [Candidatus Lokiarchaeota archaeon]
MIEMEEEKIYYVQLRKEYAQDFLDIVKSIATKDKILDPQNKVIHQGDFILFPLNNFEKTKKLILDSIPDRFNINFVKQLRVVNLHFKFRSIEDALQGKISQKYEDLIPKSYDIIGEIAIIEFDDRVYKENLTNIKKQIAKAIIHVNKNVKTVYEKTSKIKGIHRVRDLKLLEGKNQTLTLHKENSCLFKVDIKKTFFTPRLINERKRISELKFKKGEIIVDLFSGVGPFSIQIAKRREALIYAFDVNKTAIVLLKKNIQLNQLKGTIIPYNLDVKKLKRSHKEISQTLKNNSDRIIMNLPEKAVDFLDIAIFLLKNEGGIIHIYSFSDKPSPPKRAFLTIEQKLNELGWTVQEKIFARSVKSYSPETDLVVLDLLIKQNKLEIGLN